MLAFAFSIVNLSAQNDTTKVKDIFDYTLEELMQLEVYTASKTSQKATDAPATVYVVTKDQIDARNYSSLEELLEDIPQIEIQKKSISQSSDIFSINGVSGSEKFIILMNGIRINSTTGTVHTISESYSLTNVKQVEIILGPASSLYGADAFTGIINIITEAGYENKGIHLSSSYGLYNTTDNTLSYGVGNKDISFSISGKYYHSDEAFLPDYYPEDYEWYNNYAQTGEMSMYGDTIKPALGIQPWSIPTDAYSVQANLKLKKFNFGYSRFYENHNNSVSSVPSTNIYCNESAYINHLQNIYATHNFVSNNEKFVLNSTLSGQEYKTYPQTAYVNQYTNYEIDYKYERNRTAKIEEQINYKFSDKFNIVGGASYEYINSIPITSDLPVQYDQTKTPEEQNIYYPGTNVTDKDGNDLTIYQDFFNLNYYNIGSYLQFQYKILKNMTLTAGSRYDYNSRYKSTINPRVGLVYNPISKLTIKLLYGQAYLSPSPFKSYQHFGSFYPATNDAGEITGIVSDYFFLPNPNLEPEKRISYDTYIMYQINPNFAALINTYYGQISNLISTTGAENVVFHDVTVGYVETMTNQGNSIAYGGTFRLDYKGYIGNFFNINLFAAYSYSDGNISDNPLIYSAKNTVKTGLNMRFKQKFNLYFKTQYRTGSHYIFSTYDQPIMNKDFFVMSATANYKIINKKAFKVNMFINISNLSDTRYYNVGENFELTPQDPIRVDFGLKFDM